MPLENTSIIDIVLRDEAGSPVFLITDSGQTSNPQERLRLLHAKLANYVTFVFSSQFAKDFPGMPPVGDNQGDLRSTSL